MKPRYFIWHIDTKQRHLGKPNIQMSRAAESCVGYSVCRSHTGTGEMPGRLSYIVAKDSADDNAIWITEIWESKASYDTSLSLPSVKSAIAKAKPMIAIFGTPVVTTSVGGHGLQSTQNP